LELFCNAQQYNQTGVSWPTQAFWLAALKTDRPITGNYWVIPYLLVANTAWPSYRRIARWISNFVYVKVQVQSCHISMSEVMTEVVVCELRVMW